MNRIQTRTQILALLLCLLVSQPLAAQSQKVLDAISDATSGVVTIQYYTPNATAYSTTTGIILSSDGFLAASASQLSKATWVVAQLSDKREITASTLMHINEANDIIIFKLDGGGLPAVGLAKSGAASPRSLVYGITTSGMNEGKAAKSIRNGKQVILQNDLKLTDAQSGSAVLNKQGRFAGMMSAKLKGTLPFGAVRAALAAARKSAPQRTLAATKPVLGPEIRKTFYPNGNVKTEATYLGVVQEGITKTYTEDGKLQLEEMFKANALNGITKEYFASGVVKRESMYKDGKKNGEEKTFYDISAFTESIAMFQNDMRVGNMKRFNYYANGNLKEEAAANPEGKYEGIKKFFYEDGLIKIEENYQNGIKQGIRRLYYDNGLLAKAQTWLNDKQTGVENVYTEKGRLMASNTFDAGKWIRSQEMNEDGRVARELDADEIADKVRKENERLAGK
jgi:antitoxin component YwqK of YwqJK toxin-antitoxin module